ncbi:MAG: hypothetical protein A2557_08155 [Candidatus Lambdaproteobacteria bacterium RIFOXYD2_FULL_56_26]|uniref:Outer membrane protein beta-barrel domain-containing protein n=1 Tax=Candidatus Lambdaproteobacteria bacterium RIFOXYD2_FULL_56_26 TaxID=1817773 RepID=A0A1F6H3I1_9PROT|nr:MAG: hypothetical protein A2557_08155 [Candidatus Lambdaproteobacteria bacterium RIFOXYD2_FULL_56_26]
MGLFCSAWWGAKAQAADLLFFGLEAPLSYKFDQAKDGGRFAAQGSPAGLILYAKAPEVGMVMLEAYDVALKNSENSKFSYLLADFLYPYSLPFLDLAFGVGMGTANLKSGFATEYQQATAYQWIFQAGLPITETIRLTYSYHSVTAQLKYLSGNTYLEAGGTMTALGIGMGF